MRELFHDASQNELQFHLEVTADYIKKHYPEILSLNKPAADAHLSNITFIAFFATTMVRRWMLACAVPPGAGRPHAQALAAAWRALGSDHENSP